MGTRGRYWGEREGEAVVGQWRASGLSCRAFCQGRGIQHQRLQYWIARQASAAAVWPSAAGFVELRGPASPPISAGSIEVVVAGGARVRVSAGFDAALLRAVVEALS